MQGVVFAADSVYCCLNNLHFFVFFILILAEPHLGIPGLASAIRTHDLPVVSLPTEVKPLTIIP